MMTDNSPKNDVETKKQHPFHDERGKFNGRPVPGNGRPKGSRHRATILAQALIDGQADAIVQSIIAAALGGDVTAAKAVLDRIVPPRKSSPIQIELPPIDSAENAKLAITVIIDAQASGDLTAEEAASLLASVKTWLEVNAVAELDEKVSRLLAGNV